MSIELGRSKYIQIKIYPVDGEIKPIGMVYGYQETMYDY